MLRMRKRICRRRRRASYYYDCVQIKRVKPTVMVLNESIHFNNKKMAHEIRIRQMI